ncbi:hypothetical protein F943_02183 [Acinetobacter ursingii NIPH 706]|uniref:hypothetical protein n=1 Tax=Acinetobacter ursingii TaxID=108980 RepID=UPI0002CE8E92|nr:hypothetical protein [Acinetobacter ursingii]ENX48650.1 hypothetical protein F943_02183 [Acinetobacter ursingii NIPH 706]
MKYFKKIDDSVWAFEEDGSQDEFITNEFTSMTAEEIDRHLNPQKYFTDAEKAAIAVQQKMIHAQSEYDRVSIEITRLNDAIEDEDGDLEELNTDKAVLVDYRKFLRAFLKSDGLGELPDEPQQ